MTVYSKAEAAYEAYKIARADAVAWAAKATETAEIAAVLKRSFPRQDHVFQAVYDYRIEDATTDLLALMQAQREETR